MGSNFGINIFFFNINDNIYVNNQLIIYFHPNVMVASMLLHSCFEKQKNILLSGYILTILSIVKVIKDFSQNKRSNKNSINSLLVGKFGMEIYY